jgi:type IV pilus assembly protein PilB
MPKKKLGEVLRERGHISADNLAKALDEQSRRVGLLGEALLERGLVGKKDLVAALEEITNIPYVHCLSADVDPEVLKLIPRGVAVRNCMLPLMYKDNKVVAVMAEPQNLLAIDELSFVAGKAISPRLGFRTEILAAIDKFYGEGEGNSAAAEAEKASGRENARLTNVEFLSVGSRHNSREAVQEIQEELRSQPSPAVRLVSEAIVEAVAKDASDIHIEPQNQGMVVRVRVDGVLRELMRIPDELQATVISRVKVLADLDIAERRNPQDGRIEVRVGGRNIDLRISTLPTRRGEKVVIRLLDPSAPRFQFSDLGMSPQACESLSEILDRPQGLLLVTGPTGSRKTTTLYAALHQLRSPNVNIVTVEDPVEYMLEGVNQVQVNSKAGLTFAKCLRSILRQDPNIIMVGEIRDGETAEIALKAAQTGHLVLTTVHTNDSIAAIARLMDLQIPPFLIASSLTAILSQRLIRKLCSCSERVASTPEYTARMLASGFVDPEETMNAPVGCAKCDHTGYRGRIGVFEMLVPDEKIRDSIRSGNRPDELRDLAQTSGMKAMQEDALEKARLGLTTLKELSRVVPFEHAPASRCHNCQREIAPTFLFCPYCAAKRQANNAHTPVPVGQGVDSE